MIRRPPRSTLSSSSAASDVYKRQGFDENRHDRPRRPAGTEREDHHDLSLIHISEPTRLLSTSYAVFCLKKKQHITVSRQATSESGQTKNSYKSTTKQT